MVNLNNSVEIENKLIIPEQKLWKAVLAQSLYDSLFGDYRSLQTDYEKKEAKEWIDLNNDNFKQVCEYAGFNPQFVFNLLKKKGKLCLVK